MATIYPQWLPTSVKSPAERKLFDVLRDHLPNEYTVLWSIDWTASRPVSIGGGAQESEIDFLVLHPDKGILVLEIKGGGVGYDASRHEWYTIDNKQRRHAIKNPFEQAQTGKHALRRELTQQVSSAWLRTTCQRCTFAHAVVVPDIDKAKLANRPTRPDEFILDHQDLQANAIHQAINGAYTLWRRSDAQPLGHNAVDEIVKIYAPSWYIRPPLINEFEEEQAQLKKLTEQQFIILDTLRRQKQIAISGCAGSGKTFLAIEQAKRLARQGFSVLVTCYNSNLAGWLRRRLAEQAQDDPALQTIDVEHFHRLAARLCNQAGTQLPTNEDRLYDEAFAEGLLKASEKIEQRYDAIIADEGQDFNDTWWIALLSLLRSEENGIFAIYYDDNQRIYGRQSNLPIPPDHYYSLTMNCRTTKKIHTEVVKYYNADDMPECTGPIGRDVERFSIVGTAGNERKTLAELLKRLTQDEGIPLEELILLSPVGKDRSRFREGDRIGQFRLSWNMFGTSSPNTLICCTVFSFKGLERDIVILAEPDKIQQNAEREQLIYVALSRAKFHLIILGNLP